MGDITRCGRRQGWGDEERSEGWWKGVGGVEGRHMAWIGALDGAAEERSSWKGSQLASQG